jgi:hypothetical protein
MTDALYLAGGCALSFVLILAGILCRLLVPRWAYANKSRECEMWKDQCDIATNLASQATTIAEHLARSNLHGNISQTPGP